jgi:hypothetical protein
MSQEDDNWERKKELFRLTSPEFRLLELIEKLTQTVEKVDQESRLRDGEQQRQINFIIEQQAQFAVGMQQLREAQTRAEDRWERAEEKWDRMWERTHGNIVSLVAAAELQSHQIDGLAEAQANTNRQMAETTEKLDALINVVERIVSERENGG